MLLFVLVLFALDKVSLGSDQLYSLGRIGGAEGPSNPPQGGLWRQPGTLWVPPPEPTTKCKVRKNLVLALRAIVIGIWAVIGTVITGSVVGYEVVVHCNFSCELFW